LARVHNAPVFSGGMVGGRHVKSGMTEGEGFLKPGPRWRVGNERTQRELHSEIVIST